MTRPRKRLAAAGIALILTGPVAYAYPAAAGPPPQAGAIKCAAEEYPPIGSPRSSAPVPYRIPFSGTLDGGTLTVGNTTKAILGPAYATLCGYLTLPTETGIVTKEELVITNNPVPISVVIDGLTLLSAYLELEGTMTASVNRRPAANGGLNLDLYATFKATVIPDLTGPGGISVPAPQLFGCTTAAGDQNLMGDSPPDIAALKAKEASNPAKFDFFAPIHFTTGTSGALTGQPVTGPVTNGQTKVVANDFPYPQVFGDTPETTRPAPPTNPGCSPFFASLFNSSLGLPQPAGNAQFIAPAHFSIHVTA